MADAIVEKTLKRSHAKLDTPSTFEPEVVEELSGAINALLADTFAIYLKTKSFHWHISGPHFRDYHLLLDEQAAQLFDTTDVLAERVRKLGGTTIRSIGHISRLQRVLDNDAEFVEAHSMLAELRDDNKQLLESLEEAHDLCADKGDVATASILEQIIDDTERRVWFLFESTRSS